MQLVVCCTWTAQPSISVDAARRGRTLRRRAEKAAAIANLFEINRIADKKQGAAGITTAAPYVTGQWGRGDNRLPE
jgi:hypothetical protein